MLTGSVFATRSTYNTHSCLGPNLLTPTYMLTTNNLTHSRCSSLYTRTSAGCALTRQYFLLLFDVVMQMLVLRSEQAISCQVAVFQFNRVALHLQLAKFQSRAELILCTVLFAACITDCPFWHMPKEQSCLLTRDQLFTWTCAAQMSTAAAKKPSKVNPLRSNGNAYIAAKA